MAVLSPTTVNGRVNIQGYRTKEARNFLVAEKIEKQQIVKSVRELNQYTEEFKANDPPLALAFILLAWNHIIEHKIKGELFSPMDAKIFLENPMLFLATIHYPLNTFTRRPINPFNHTQKWPD